MKNASSATTWPRKVFHAGFWAFSLKGVEHVLLLCRVIILARLLQPEDFGLFGIGLMTIMALEAFSYAGIDQALIQKDKDVRPYLNTAWTAQAFRGLMLTAILWAIAPVIAAFFNEPAVIPLLRVIGVSMTVQGLTNIGVISFQRELNFGREFALRFSGLFADFAVAVSCAFLLRDAWALVFGFVARSFVTLIVSYWIHPYRPRVMFDSGKFVILFKYGIWVLFAAATMFIGTQGAGLMVGRVLGVTALGLYQFATRIPRLLIQETGMTIGKVAFPAFSQLQGSPERLRAAYLRIAGVSVAICIPVATGIMVMGEDFVGIFLGRKWMLIVPILDLLALASLINSIAHTGRPIFMASGIPKALFHMQIARAVTIMLFTYPLALRWGIYGASVAELLSGISMFAVAGLNIRRHIELGRKDLTRLFAPPLGASVVMAICVYALKPVAAQFRTGTNLSDMAWFGLIVLAGGLVYLSVMVLLHLLVPKYGILKGTNVFGREKI